MTPIVYDGFNSTFIGGGMCGTVRQNFGSCIFREGNVLVEVWYV